MKIKVRYYTLAQMRRIDRDYPHPEGSVEAGWYWRARGDAPVGPFSDEASATADSVSFFAVGAPQ